VPAAADPRPPLLAERLARSGVEVVAEAGSTNALVAERARGGAGEGLVVVTEHQTAGRGRLDRAWHTPPRAALTFSLLLRPGRPVAEWPWLPLLAGVAVVGGLRAHDVPAELKWPNDVLLGDHKTAGILAERIDTPTGAAAVVGIGLNVTSTAEELPVPTATSVRLATGSAPDRTALLEELVNRLRQQYGAWSVEGAAGLRPAYAALCSTLGRDVRVSLPDGGELVGPATEVDDLGRLVVAGTPVAAGDVVHVRPAG
jgi:BirA family transcriptional regulator, biotin operon repressor / biotin---[acetyl-CoA-carboxylase] ligase